MALVCDVLDRRDDDTHVGTLCWELGGRCSDQTIARLHVDTGVVWGFLISLAVTMDIYIHHLPCVIYEVLCISIPLTAESVDRYNTIIYHK
jgi:hypothetical protein